MEPVIETVFRCHIHYEARGSKVYEKIETRCDAVMRAKRYAKVDLSTWSRGPAWEAYFVLEGADKDLVMKAAKSITAVILSYKGSAIIAEPEDIQ